MMRIERQGIEESEKQRYLMAGGVTPRLDELGLIG